MSRIIKRIAFLQDYRNRPENLKCLISEVAKKGYHAISLYIPIGHEQIFFELAEEARKYNLEVMCFTGFMKYERAWLKEHPEQRLVFCSELDTLDQDKVSIDWGCPFNPDFQNRYFKFLNTLSEASNLTEVWINDEAFLGLDENRLGCFCHVCRQDWKDEFGEEMPLFPFKHNREKSRFVQWRFRRWNIAHGKMKDALNRHGHDVRAVFLTAPLPCIGLNTWVTGIDIRGMMKYIDGVMTDPYYTFHDVYDYTRSYPKEIYLSEYCRYLRGVAGNDKIVEMCVQGFSQATFTRPLDECDGWWSSVVPLALGVDNITAYTYTLQKISPVQKSFEKAFRFDSYFAETAPLEFAAIVDSLETKTFHHDDCNVRGLEQWQHSRMIPLADTLRHHGLPYTYISSTQLEDHEFFRFPVLVLPGVSCLSETAKENLKEYVKTGGVLVACGETAVRNEFGEEVEDSFLKELFGIKLFDVSDEGATFETDSDFPSFFKIPELDETTSAYMGGVYRPVLGLSLTVSVEITGNAVSLARFQKNRSGKPALTEHSYGNGKAVFLAGIPERNFFSKEYSMTVLNYASRILSNLIFKLAGDKLPLFAKGFPPSVPIAELRPTDPRLLPTVEFMPCVGENLFIATAVSYFKEPMKFTVEAKIPGGKKCGKIKELVSGEKVNIVRNEDNVMEIEVSFDVDDCIKIFVFYFE